MKNAQTFEGAAGALVDLLLQVDHEQWDAPGLGVWSVRSLAGHASRAILTVEQYLQAPAPAVAELRDAESYFLSVKGGSHGTPVDDDAVAQRGVDAGLALGATPAKTVREALERGLRLLSDEPDGRIVQVLGDRSISLAEYLRTRVFELVVHTLDLSHATGIRADIPKTAIEESAALAARIAAREGHGGELLFALTGRLTLPDGFSVV